MLYLPNVSQAFILSELPHAARLLESSCFEKITMCNQDNALDVAAFPDE